MLPGRFSFLKTCFLSLGVHSAGHSRPGGVQCNEGAVHEDRGRVPHRLLCDRQSQLRARGPLPSAHPPGQRPVGQDWGAGGGRNGNIRTSSRTTDNQKVGCSFL